MPYIGRGPAKSGAFRILDDISGSFNGSTTSFALTVGSTALTVGLPETLTIAVDGVIQEPGSAFTISGSNIVFTAAPQADATFWGVELGDVGGLADRAVTQLASDDSTKVATTAYVDNQIDVQLTAEDLDVTSDSGTIAIDLDSETLTIAGGEGIDTSGSSNTITIAGEDASTSNKGVASFHSDNFAVSSGAVTIKDNGVRAAELYTTSGTAGSGTFLRGDETWAAAGATDNSVRVTMSGAQSIATSTAVTLLFGAETYDTDAFHNTGSNTGRLTCPSVALAGKYIVCLSVRFDGNTTGERIAYINHSADGVLAKLAVDATSNVNQETELAFSTIADLANGEYVTAIAHQNSGGALNVASTNTNFCMIRIA